MMRPLRFPPAALAPLALVLALAGCDAIGVQRAGGLPGVVDAGNMGDIMLTSAPPDEAVAYFTRAHGDQPDSVTARRGLATSLVRAGRADEAVPHWAALIATDAATDEDRVAYAGALIRSGNWAEAEAQLAAVPPTFETYERYRLEAMVADSKRQWDRADTFYEIAVGLTTRPANVLNNWGFSRLTRGAYPAAEALFLQAISYDPDLFTAKNNLVLARAAQGNYQMPLVRMTEIERAQLLHTAALAAIRQGQTDVGRGLLSDAIETHPQHFDAAVRALAALDTEVRR